MIFLKRHQRFFGGSKVNQMNQYYDRNRPDFPKTPSEAALDAGDTHAIHYVARQPERHRLRRREDAALLESDAWRRRADDVTKAPLRIISLPKAM